MRTSKLYLIFILFILVTMTSCGSGGGGGGGGEGGDVIINPGGDALKVIAVAGGDQIGSIQVPITLDGSGSSTDGAGDLTYLWEFVTKPLGSSATLSTPTSVKTSIMCDMPGTYIVKLVVTSQGVDSVADNVIIKAFVPIANAGPNQLVSTGTTVTLDGSGSNYGGEETLYYNWTITSRPAGSIATIFDSSVVKPTFFADVNGDYEISLVVSNGNIDSVVDTVTVKSTTVPVANAGPDQTVSTGSTVHLDGRASSTSDGSTLTYLWSLVSKPITSSAALSDPTAAIPTFKTDVKGTYKISLVVNNGWEKSAEDSVTITATPPVANAGVDQKVSTGVVITLDGSGSSDASGTTIIPAWTIKSTPTGSTAALSNPASINPAFKADVSGAYVIGLVVNNGIENSAEDTVTVTAVSPVANAGLDRKVSTGSTVTLDGSGSKDANGYPITYKWTIKSRPTGGLATLNDSTAIKPTFIANVDGIYEVGLVVNNGIVDSAEDTITVTSTTAPVANAGPDQSVSTAQPVTLNGNGSSDSKGAPLIYTWTIKSFPSGSIVKLSGYLTVNPTFIADKAGVYVIGLVVNNGTENSVEDTVTVTAVSPDAVAGPNYNITPGSTVILDGRRSSDANGYPLTFQWTVTSSPLGSTSTLSDPTSQTPSFTADIEGAYEISLTVNNGFVDSEKKVIIINVRISVGKNSGIFSTDFEDPNEKNLWLISNGLWDIGTPTSGPAVAYIGSGVAATVLDGDYTTVADSRFVSPTIQLPTLAPGEEIYLRFNYWAVYGSCPYSSCTPYCSIRIATDAGRVQISQEGSWDVWSTLSTLSGSSIWSTASIELTSYAGKYVRIGFLIEKAGYCSPSIGPGWYIDEVLVEVR